jgi:pyocin large subunit-like protein
MEAIKSWAAVEEQARYWTESRESRSAKNVGDFVDAKAPRFNKPTATTSTRII